jgi:hypothetical protein
MLASGYEAMLKFRDDVLHKFNNLVDAELAVMAEPELEPERLREDSQPAMARRENRDSVVIEAGEGAMSPSPVFSDELVTKDDR